MTLTVGGEGLSRGVHIIGPSTPAPLGSLSTYTAAVLADSPAGFWIMGESSYIGATAPQDSSGNGRHCRNEGDTVSPTATAGAPTSGQTHSPVFDGTDDRFTVDDAAAWDATTLSVEAWVNGVTSLAGVVTRSDVNAPGGIADRSWDCRVSTTGPWIRRDSGSDETAYQATDPTGIDSMGAGWHQIVWTYQAGTGGFQAYVDGTACAGVDTTGTLNTGALPILFGARQDRLAGTGATSFNTGRICLVSIYPGSILSAARVLAHYQAAVG